MIRIEGFGVLIHNYGSILSKSQLKHGSIVLVLKYGRGEKRRQGRTCVL